MFMAKTATSVAFGLFQTRKSVVWKKEYPEVSHHIANTGFQKCKCFCSDDIFFFFCCPHCFVTTTACDMVSVATGPVQYRAPKRRRAWRYNFKINGAPLSSSEPREDSDKEDHTDEGEGD